MLVSLVFQLWYILNKFGTVLLQKMMLKKLFNLIS